MNNLSRRHHYIPRCLIRRFAAKDGYLYVFDKQKQEVNRKYYKNIFFDWNRNTFEHYGELQDNVEKFYSEFDNVFGKHLNNILKNLTLNGKEQTFLIFMANFLKWRVPASDQAFSLLKQQLSYADLGLQLRFADVPDKKTESALIDQAEHDEIYNEFKRIVIAFQVIMDKESLKNIFRDCFMLSQNTYPGLIGDRAIIESPLRSGEQMNSFIFPVSKNETFIYKKGASKTMDLEAFYICKDISIFSSADRYAACADLAHLKLVIEKCHLLAEQNKLESVGRLIFDMVD